MFQLFSSKQHLETTGTPSPNTYAVKCGQIHLQFAQLPCEDLALSDSLLMKRTCMGIYVLARLLVTPCMHTVRIVIQAHTHTVCILLLPSLLTIQI